MSGILNRGTGAGGANTNMNGKSFEDKTSNEEFLLQNGFVKYEIAKKKMYYLEKKENNKTILFFKQGGLKAYFKWKYDKEICRHPDEAYLIITPTSKILKIIEKKNQTGAGSVDTKLMCGPGFIYEYKFCCGPDFEVEYAFCLSKYLEEEYKSEQKKYICLRKMNLDNNIKVFFGDSEEYLSKINEWINL